MEFGDLQSDSGISKLNDYLKDKSYIEGYQPSAADTVVYVSVSSALHIKPEFNHALRWFTHITSYGKGISAFPGVPKSIAEFGSTAGKVVKKAKDEEDDDSDFDLFDDDVPAPKSVSKKDDENDDDDDDFDPFASDDEDEAEKEKVKQERVAAYTARKAKKPALIAKSSILLDVKPWDDETDMEKLEECVRTVQADGLKWGASKFVPLAYGIKKLQIVCVVEDDKVGTDFLEEQITAFEDFIQSVDIAAFNKI